MMYEVPKGFFKENLQFDDLMSPNKPSGSSGGLRGSSGVLCDFSSFVPVFRVLRGFTGFLVV